MSWGLLRAGSRYGREKRSPYSTASPRNDDKKIKQKSCDEYATAQNEQGTEIDLVSVYRRTPRRQIANCIKGCEDCDGHQECAPFFGFFLLRFEVYTNKTGCVKDYLKCVI